MPDIVRFRSPLGAFSSLNDRLDSVSFVFDSARFGFKSFEFLISPLGFARCIRVVFRLKPNPGELRLWIRKLEKLIFRPEVMGSDPEWHSLGVESGVCVRKWLKLGEEVESLWRVWWRDPRPPLEGELELWC